MLALAFTLLSAASSVLAHGIVEEITIGNPASTYTSYLPYTDPYKVPVPERITRKLLSNGPVEDVTSIDIQCNAGAEPAALVAEVAAGSAVAFNWTTAWPTSHMGPVITYMAKAPSDITKWSPGSDAVWFKIDEAGLEDGKWAGTDILLANGGVHTVTIPSTLKAGQYLIRHEIIALHAAGSYPGAQFYPMCAQLEVTGSGTALPADSELVSFPGAYTPESPGIVYNPYQGSTTYPIPGPAVWNGSGSGSGSGSPAATTTAVSSTTAAAPTTAVPSSTETAFTTEDAATEVPEETSAPAPSVVTSTAAAATTTNVAPPPTSAGALATLYAQCGGRNFNGPQGCASPYVCKSWNEWYSQCVGA